VEPCADSTEEVGRASGLKGFLRANAYRAYVAALLILVALLLQPWNWNWSAERRTPTTSLDLLQIAGESLFILMVYGLWRVVPVWLTPYEGTKVRPWREAALALGALFGYWLVRLGHRYFLWQP